VIHVHTTPTKEHTMTDTEYTDAQIAAYRDLTHPSRTFTTGQMALLAPLFPTDFLKAAIGMPEEPGVYVGPGGTNGPLWRLDEAGGAMYQDGGQGYALPGDGPFRRLLIEGAVER
jgi:hypothetical protein